MSTEELMQKMRNAVPGVFDREKKWVMEPIIQGGVVAQEKMIRELAVNGEYTLKTYELIRVDEKMCQGIILRIRAEVDGLIRYWRAAGIECYIVSGPYFVEREDSSDGYEHFCTKITLLQ